MSDHGDSVPPCWAADPSGQHRFRWWDGTAWTGHVFDGDVPPVGAPGPPPTESIPLELGTEWWSESERTPSQRELDDEYPADTGEDSGTRTHRRPARDRRDFLMGVLAGGIGVAVLAAIAWLTLGGSSDTEVATPASTTTSRQATTTTEATSSTVAPSTTVAVRAPAQVRVEVLNASGTAGVAAAQATKLETAGYAIAGTGDATRRQGKVVTCKPGFDAEAAALAQAVGSGATVEPFPTPPPTGSEDADCVVILGT